MKGRGPGLALVKKRINDGLRNESGASLWFSTMLHCSLVVTVGNQNAEFTEVGSAALQMLGRNTAIVVHDDNAQEILAGMRHTWCRMPMWRRRWRVCGMRAFKLAPLTLASQAGVKAQLSHAGLDKYFERPLSVDSVQRFKPHRDVYHTGRCARWSGASRLRAGGGPRLGRRWRAVGRIAKHGVLIALVGWLVMMVVLMPMAGAGMFGMAMGPMAPVMTLVLHLIFGVVLGWTYGRLVAGTAPDTAGRGLQGGEEPQCHGDPDDRE